MLGFSKSLGRLSAFHRKCNFLNRHKSAWIKLSSGLKPSSSDDVDVENLFINDNVQLLLKKLTGLDADGKVFAERYVDKPQRSHFALMTDSMLEEVRANMNERATKYLQFVPLKEPRMNTFSVLAKDSEISGFDTAKFVFTDITFDATNEDRTVVIREPDGTLRTALPEEHDRMNRVYYEQPNRPSFAPAVFTDPDLKNALDADRHEFVMDFACWFCEPDDPEFVKLSQTVFDRIVEAEKFDVLYSTRHFGTFAFYLALNNNVLPLLNHFQSNNRIHDAANLIRLQKVLFPDWRASISSADSDEKIVNDFLRKKK